MVFIPQTFKNVKFQKMGRNAVFSSSRAINRNQLLRMHTAGLNATKGILSEGSYPNGVTVRRKPKTLKTTGGDYVQLKKWRELSK
jgi:hypothetical protein